MLYNSLQLARKYALIFVICSSKLTVSVLERKTVSFEEQMISKDQYSIIFWRKIEAIVFILYFKLENILKKFPVSNEVGNIW